MPLKIVNNTNFFVKKTKKPLKTAIYRKPLQFPKTITALKCGKKTRKHHLEISPKLNKVKLVRTFPYTELSDTLAETETRLSGKSKRELEAGNLNYTIFQY